MSDIKKVTELRNKVIDVITDHLHNLDNKELVAGYVGTGYVDMELMFEFYKAIIDGEEHGDKE